MRVRVLGCSGGIAAGLETTSFQVDDDILLDAGTGAASLTMEELLKVRHIFITHSHLDHVAGLPLMVDTLFGNHTEPLKVHAHPETLGALKAHIFNWVIWPNFAEIELQGVKALEFVPMEHGDVFEVNGKSVEMVPVNHTVPGVAYIVSELETDKSFAFSGDTTTNDTLWDAINKRGGVDMLLVECGFPDEYSEIAELSKHYSPKTLAEDLKKLEKDMPIAISHLKPGHEAHIAWELAEAFPGHNLVRMVAGDEYEL